MAIDPDVQTLLDPVVAKQAAHDAALADHAARLAALEARPSPPAAAHWDVPFATRSNSPSVTIQNAANVTISGKTFRGTEVRQISLYRCTNVTLTDLDFDGSGGGIYLLECSGTLDAGWLRYRNLAGPDGKLIQLDDSHMTGRIHDFKGKGGKTSDVVSVYKSGGPDAAHPLVIENFAIEGVDWTNASGSGVMLGDQGGGHTTVRNGTLLNCGSCGIGIAGGVDNHITDLVVYGAQRAGSNIGLYVWNQSGQPSSGHEVARCKVEWFKADGTHNNNWDAGNSGAIAGWSTNQWGIPAAINPATLKVTL